MLKLLTTKDFVNEFGTKGEIKKYESGKMQDKYIKGKIFNKAKTKCNIEFIGDGNYKIIEYYNRNKPLFLIENFENIYYYISFNVLKQLQNKYHTETTPLIIGKMGWNKQIDMINENYYKIKFNKDEASELLNINIDNIYDFYSVVSKSLNYYVKNTLDMLKKQKLLEYEDDILMICTHSQNVNGYKTELREQYRQATDEEKRTILDIKYKIIKEMGLDKNEEHSIYYKRREEFKVRNEEELRKIGIYSTYNAYKIFYTTKSRVDNFLKWYKEDNTEIIKIMNMLFIDITNKNAKLRNKNEFYIENYSKLSDLILKTVDYCFLNLNQNRIVVDVKYGFNSVNTNTIIKE